MTDHEALAQQIEARPDFLRWVNRDELLWLHDMVYRPVTMKELPPDQSTITRDGTIIIPADTIRNGETLTITAKGIYDGVQWSVKVAGEWDDE